MSRDNETNLMCLIGMRLLRPHFLAVEPRVNCGRNTYTPCQQNEQRAQHTANPFCDDQCARLGCIRSVDFLDGVGKHNALIAVREQQRQNVFVVCKAQVITAKRIDHELGERLLVWHRARLQNARQ